MSQKQERRCKQKADLREKLASSDKDTVLASLVPRVLTKHDRALQAKEKRKKQQADKPCKKGSKGGKNKPSKKFKASAFAKKSCSKENAKKKPSAILKNKTHSARNNMLRDLQRAVARMTEKAEQEHGMTMKGRKRKSEESLESPSKKGKPVANTEKKRKRRRKVKL